MTQAKLNLNHLKKYLKTCSQDELIQDVVELFKKSQAVKDYYQIKLYPEQENQIAARYKKIIEDEFFPSRGFGKARLSVAKKAISEYKKACRTDECLVDVMLFYVEQGVKFTNAYGDIDEPFYISMEGMYEKAVANIVKQGLQDMFLRRCRRIVEETSGTGWGFYDALSDIYDGAF